MHTGGSDHSMLRAKRRHSVPNRSTIDGLSELDCKTPTSGNVHILEPMDTLSSVDAGTCLILY